MVHAAVLENLHQAAQAAGTGKVVGPVGFRLGPDTVIAPDVAFIRRDGHPETLVGWPEFGPDLAIEILAYDDDPSWMERRIAYFLAAGSSTVWVLDPESITVSVYDKSGEFRTLNADDMIDAPDLLPGFSVPVRTMFE
jgi:Uma2 family endonuclease